MVVSFYRFAFSANHTDGKCLLLSTTAEPQGGSGLVQGADSQYPSVEIWSEQRQESSASTICSLTRAVEKESRDLFWSLHFCCKHLVRAIPKRSTRSSVPLPQRYNPFRCPFPGPRSGQVAVPWPVRVTAYQTATESQTWTTASL